MKNKMIGIIVLTIIIGVSLFSCSGGGSSGHKDFYGTWVRDRTTYIISEKEITYIVNSNDGSVYVKEIYTIDSITPMKDDNDPNYPTGFRFDRKLKEIEGESFSVIGSDYPVTLWIHTGKKEFTVGSDRRGIYKKQ